VLQTNDLLGRDREIAAIENALRAAEAGHGSLSILAGPAGIGKSAILARAVSLASSAGFTPLTAIGAESELEFPFGVARQLYARAHAEAVHSEHLGLVSALFAPSRPAGREPVLSFQMLDALYWFLSDLAQDAPLLIAVDDIHWADQPSLQHLGFLARRLEGMPVALLLAERSEQPTNRARDELADLVQRTLAPRALAGDEIAELITRTLGRIPSAGYVAACLQQTSGYPLYLREVLRATAEAGLEPDDAAALAIESFDAERLARHVWRRVDAIGPEAGGVAGLVSVLGDRAYPPAIAELASLDLTEVEDILDLLITQGVLRPGQPSRFAHPVVRTAIDRGPSPRQVDAWHRAAAEWLQAEKADVRDIAAHLIECSPRGDAWVIECLQDFANVALGSGAPEAAATALSRALLERPALPLRVRLLRELALAEDAADDPQSALEHLHEARGEARDRREVAEIAIAEGQVLARLYRHHEAAAVLDKGLEALDGSDEELVQRIDAELINSALMSPEARERGLERLARYGDLVPEGPAAQAVLTARAVAAALTAQPAEQTAELAEAALRAGDLSQGGLGSVIWTLSAWALMYMNRPEVARELTEAELPAVRRGGHPREISTIEVTIGCAALQQGDLPGAVSRTEAALGLFSGAWGYGINALALVEIGDLAAAERSLAAVPRDEWDETVSGSFPLCYARTRLRIGEHRLDDAEVDIDELRRRSEAYPPGLRGLEEAWRLLAAEVARQRGDRDRALELIDGELEYAHKIGAQILLGMALRAAGLTQGHEGINSLTESVAVLARSPYRLEHARSLVALGGALRRNGERVAAREPLREGLDLAYRCGANSLVGDAQAELKAAGARPRRALLEGPEALTPREARMAILAAEGNSNRDIAQQLYVTLATVEGTLWRAYGKLGISGHGAREALPQALGPLFDPPADSKFKGRSW
jgi:DNA-binding CsgD family transcriptional regulator